MRTQFGGTMGERMKSAYGAFCSRHNDALQLYKALLKSDVTFQEFIKVSKQNKHLTKMQYIAVHIRFVVGLGLHPQNTNLI